MLGCSNVRITEEFPSFLMSHLMRLFGIPLRLEVSIKGLQGGGGGGGGGFLCAIGCYWFFSGEVWLGVVGSQTSVIAAWTRLMKGV